MKASTILKLVSLGYIFNKNDSIFLANSSTIDIVVSIVKYSFNFCLSVFPVGINFINSNYISSASNKFCFIWNVLYTFANDSIFYLLVSTNRGTSLPSIESKFMSFSWVEREVSEFSGLTFCNKRDSRSLFLFFLVGGEPLAKAFPVIGFWSIFLTKDCYLGWRRSNMS